jgi:hypothetical protein
MPATVEGVRTFLGLSPARPVDDDALAAAVAGANAAVVVWRVDLAALDEWGANADQAATIYAARLYGRRGSVQGVAAYEAVGVMALPQDPDVSALLGLGKFQRSVVA